MKPISYEAPRFGDDDGILCQSFSSGCPFSSYVIHSLGGISALYSVSYGGHASIVNTIFLERFLAAVEVNLQRHGGISCASSVMNRKQRHPCKANIASVKAANVL